jgi:hypothetical protein
VPAERKNETKLRDPNSEPVSLCPAGPRKDEAFQTTLGGRVDFYQQPPKYFLHSGIPPTLTKRHRGQWGTPKFILFCLPVNEDRPTLFRLI